MVGLAVPSVSRCAGEAELQKLATEWTTVLPSHI